MRLLSSMLILFTSLVLTACGGDDKEGLLTITPISTTVKVGTTTTFEARFVNAKDSGVTWSVAEANGGTITSDGVYTAPAAAGSFRIVAKAKSGSLTTSAAVTVVPLDSASVRVFHASPDAPSVNLWVNDAVAKSKLDYAQSTGSLSLIEGTYKIAVEGIIPSGNQVVIGPVNLPLAPKTHYDVIAVNSVASIEPLVLSDTGSLSDKTKVRVRVAHLAKAAPDVKVYVTAPNADLMGLAPLGSFGFKSTIGPAEVAAGDYRIRVTLTDNTVVYDSGTVSLAAGKDLLIGAIPNVANGASPIRLAVLDGDAVTVIADKSVGADLRVVHASADAPAVDVFVNNAMTPAIAKLAFPNVQNYVNLPAATYNFKVTPTGTLTPAVIDANVPLANGMQYTLLAVGALAGIEPLLLTDNNRMVATEARVRLVHASTLANNVDIYVLPEGTSTANQTPAFANIPFKANTGYVSLAPAKYDVIITPKGEPSITAIKATLDLKAGKVYTAIARDGVNLSSPLGVIGLDGLAN